MEAQSRMAATASSGTRRCACAEKKPEAKEKMGILGQLVIADGTITASDATNQTTKTTKMWLTEEGAGRSRGW
jgi:hypothetical protein